jgi:hypothetical protein
MAVVDAAPQIDWRGAVELKNGDTTINPAKIIALPWLKAGMVGADGSAAGVAGLAPRPAATDNNSFLRGDGTWQPVSGGSSDFDKIVTDADFNIVVDALGNVVQGA